MPAAAFTVMPNCGKNRLGKTGMAVIGTPWSRAMR
jgi:23S rRNA A2030 N6-methylase RlmJ